MIEVSLNGDLPVMGVVANVYSQTIIGVQCLVSYMCRNS